MPGIVCAIRGGPASRPTIEKAIALAEETRQTVFFLYVVNLDFLAHTSLSRVNTISLEMEQMGEFILLSAQAAAAQSNVSAEGIVRHGNVGEEIVTLCQEKQAEYVVLGYPLGKEEGDIFSRERIRQFGDQIERRSGAKVIITGQMNQ